jgi:AcrR family transcriptional regulator
MTSPVAERSQRAEAARAARREEILAAARRVFAERGFRGTTIADIAEEAKIALGTIYLYFPSKEDVFAALNQRLGEIIVEAITRSGDDSTLESNVRRRINNVFEAAAQNRDLIRLVVLNTDPDTQVARAMRRGDKQRSRPIVEAIRQGMEAGVVREGDAEIISAMITGLVYIGVYQAFVISDGRRAEQFRDACADMAFAYLSPGS